MKKYRDIEVGERIFVKSPKRFNSFRMPINLLVGMVIEKSITINDYNEKTYKIVLFLFDYTNDVFEISNYDEKSKSERYLTLTSNKQEFENIIDFNNKKEIENYKNSTEAYIKSLDINNRFKKEVDDEIVEIYKTRLTTNR